MKAHAVASSYRSRSSVAAVGGASQSTNGSNGVNARQTHGDDGSSHHGVLHTLEERLAAEVRIVLAQDLVVELYHLHAADLQAFFLEHADNLTYQTAL